jgi:hypothetical protein
MPYEDEDACLYSCHPIVLPYSGTHTQNTSALASAAAFCFAASSCATFAAAAAFCFAASSCSRFAAASALALAGAEAGAGASLHVIFFLVFLIFLTM